MLFIGYELHWLKSIGISQLLYTSQTLGYQFQVILQFIDTILI